MRYEGKAEAIEAAAQAIGVPAAELKYRVVRDERSFWGGRVVEIELEEPARPESRESAAEGPRGSDGRGGVLGGGSGSFGAPLGGRLPGRDPAASRNGNALRADRR